MVRSRFPVRSVENAGGAGGAVGKGSDEGAGLSARLGPAISGERTDDGFLASVLLFFKTG